MNHKNIIWCNADEIHSIATGQIKKVSSVLDIGCGIRPQSYISPDFLICAEPYHEYVEILKSNLADTNTIILPFRALDALKMLTSKSVDSIFMIDVIEHMEKEVGLQVLEECNRVARKQIIIYTPLGYMPQEVHGKVDAWGLDGGEWQDHKSGWYPEDFAEWSIVACRELHFEDFKGTPINPPYGGFYAIKDFNHAFEAVNLGSLGDVFEAVGLTDKEASQKMTSKIIEKLYSKIKLKQGVDNSQKAAELFSKPEVVGGAEMAVLNEGDVSALENVHFALIKELEDTPNFVDWVVLKLFALSSDITEVNKREHQLNLRESYLGNTLCVRLGKWIKGLLKVN